MGSTKGTYRKKFHADETSIRQWSRVMGVTVVKLAEPILASTDERALEGASVTSAVGAGRSGLQP